MLNWIRDKLRQEPKSTYIEPTRLDFQGSLARRLKVYEEPDSAKIHVRSNRGWQVVESIVSWKIRENKNGIKGTFSVQLDITESTRFDTVRLVSTENILISERSINVSVVNGKILKIDFHLTTGSNDV